MYFDSGNAIRCIQCNNINADLNAKEYCGDPFIGLNPSSSMDSTTFNLNDCSDDVDSKLNLGIKPICKKIKWDGE